MRSVLWLLAGFLLLGTVVGQFIVPLDYGPDEPMHLEYIHVLAYEGRLPTRQETHIVQHPPLYYGLMAIPWRLLGAGQRPLSVAPGPHAMRSTPASARVARRVLRVIQTLLMCSALWMMAQILLLLKIPTRVALLWLGIAAVWPMMGYVAGVVNNENAAIAWSALLCLLTVKMVLARQISLRTALLLGLLCGAGMLVKQTTLFSFPVMLWAVWSTSDAGARWRNCAVFVAAFFSIAIWWPLHNYFVVGQFFPSYTTPADQFELPLSEKLIETPGTLRLIFETSFWPDWAARLLPRTFALAAVLSLGAAMLWLLVMSFTCRKGSIVKGSSITQEETEQTVPVPTLSQLTLPLRALQGLSIVAFALLLLGILQYVFLKDYMGQIGGRYLLNGMPWLVALCGASFSLREAHQTPDPETGNGNDTRAWSLEDPVTKVSLILLLFYAALAAIWWFMAWSYYDALINGL